MNGMKKSDTFTLDEICSLAGMNRRTVRYYIQSGIVDRPEGSGKGAFYTRRHLEQLLAVGKWKRAGLNLERIRELVADPEAAGGRPMPPAPRRAPGSIAVKSHLHLAPGLELVIDPEAAGLAPEEIRDLSRRVTNVLRHLQRKKEEKEDDDLPRNIQRHAAAAKADPGEGDG
ncbi:MAG: MerR family transcriptional regulator [Deltaproteobacteria bacterium]|nr:MerR family transcriptional regulator [Candidatus Anaeroferrophillacea bacterium]